MMGEGLVGCKHFGYVAETEGLRYGSSAVLIEPRVRVHEFALN